MTRRRDWHAPDASLRFAARPRVHGRNRRRRTVSNQPERPVASINAPPRRHSARNRRGRGVDRVDPASSIPAYAPVVSQIGDAVARAGAYLTEHPDEARYRDSAAVARLDADLRVDATGPGGELISTDMPRGIGGRASVPSPGWLFRAAAAACVASLIGIRAASQGVDLQPG